MVMRHGEEIRLARAIVERIDNDGDPTRMTPTQCLSFLECIIRECRHRRRQVRRDLRKSGAEHKK